jgi:hypothetical protein
VAVITKLLTIQTIELIVLIPTDFLSYSSVSGKIGRLVLGLRCTHCIDLKYYYKLQHKAPKPILYVHPDLSAPTLNRYLTLQ